MLNHCSHHSQTCLCAGVVSSIGIELLLLPLPLPLLLCRGRSGVVYLLC